VTLAGDIPLRDAESQGGPSPDPSPCPSGMAGPIEHRRHAPEFAAWLDAMRPRLIRLAMRLVWNAHDAEEIAQEALAVAWQRIGRLKDPAKRNAWLYSITVNLSLNHVRRPKSEPLPPVAGIADSRRQSESASASDELMRRVREATKQLPDNQQAALVLRDMEGLPYEAIATILQKRPAAARLLVHRAREGIRTTLLKRWPECFGPDK